MSLGSCETWVVCASAGPTDKPNDVEGGVGEDWSICLIKTVVGLSLASYSLSGSTGACMERRNKRKKA